MGHFHLDYVTQVALPFSEEHSICHRRLVGVYERDTRLGKKRNRFHRYRCDICSSADKRFLAMRHLSIPEQLEPNGTSPELILYIKS